MVNLRDAHVMVDGSVVSAKVQRVVEAIREYEPELDVKWIPPEARREGQAAFSIIHDSPGNSPYVLFYVNTEEEFDNRVLYKIIANDQRNGKMTYDEVESWETTQKLIQQQVERDKQEQDIDIAYHLLKTKKNTYKVNDKLIVKEGIPFNVAGTQYESR